MTLSLRTGLMLLIALAPLSAHAENWPEFRGPTGQGHAKASNLPVRWSDTENVKWKVEVPGTGWSSPVVYDGRIFLTTAVPQDTGNKLDQSLRALCLNAADGKTIWEQELFEQDGSTTQRIQKKNSHASPTPITDGKHVYVHFGTQGTACLTLDGKVVWKNDELKYVPQHGNGGSPALVDDLLILSCDGSDLQFVVALDRKTGKIRWKKDRHPIDRSQKFSFTTPLLIEVNGQRQLVSPGTNQVVAYNPKDGSEIWSVDYFGYSVIPRPVYAHGLVFVSTCYNKSSLLAIRPTGRGDVTETHVSWRTERSAPHTPSVLAVGNELYFVSDRGGVASCVDAKTGTLHWQHRLDGGFSASPVFADGKIYFQDEDGIATVVKPGKKYVELGRNTIRGARTLASYAIVDSAIYLRTSSHLYRIEKD